MLGDLALKAAGLVVVAMNRSPIALRSEVTAARELAARRRVQAEEQADRAGRLYARAAELGRMLDQAREPSVDGRRLAAAIEYITAELPQASPREGLSPEGYGEAAEREADLMALLEILQSA